MKIGFTGTQLGMTVYQMCYIDHLLQQFKPEYGIHGDCIGADAQFDKICRSLGIKVEVFPPANPKKRAFSKANILHEKDDYLARNRKIVESSDIMIAAPKSSKEELRSGTWATIRYARKIGKKIYVINPEG